MAQTSALCGAGQRLLPSNKLAQRLAAPASLLAPSTTCARRQQRGPLPTTATAEQGEVLISKPSLKPPPPRPAKEITRAPPSPRTVQAKERHLDELEQRSHSGGGSSSSGGANGASSWSSGPNNGAPGGNGRPKVNPKPAQRPGGGRPGGAGPSSSTGPAQRAGGGPPAAPGPMPGNNNARPGAGRGRGGGKQGRGRGRDAGRQAERPMGQRKAAASGNLTAENRRSARAARKRDREAKAERTEREEIIEVGAEGMAVADLADLLAVNPAEVVKVLFMKGVMVQVNQVLDAEAVKLVCSGMGVEVLDKEEGGVEDAAKKVTEFMDDDDLDFLQPRPPVVTVMGHVDHGKTSLLDYIRNTRVAAGEAGGITQSIGAYTCAVATPDGDKAVTFLDTPGHEAFSAMRARGARVTDIAIIICAADDGVQPQTIEAIGHAKAAGVPIIAAINKCDKEGAQPEKVKQMLAEHGLLPEEWGGDTPMVQISAKKGDGVDGLLETVLLVAEVEELVSNPHKPAAGTVIEAHLDKKVGPVATLLVQAGTLRVGDTLAVGCSHGRVRALRDTNGAVTEAGPSIAVQMVGLNSVPDAGDLFTVYEDESAARSAATFAQENSRLARLAEQAGGGSMITLSSLATVDDDVEALQRLNIILKADASGSVEAVKGALNALPQDSVMLRFLLSNAGDINVSDIDLAAASEGMVIGFNISPSEAVLADAKRKGVEVRTYDVIYALIDDVRAAMEGRLRGVEERTEIGRAEVKAVFGSGARKVAGCAVLEGVLKHGAVVDVTRGKRSVHDGSAINSLRRVKDDVKEVTAGTECGVSVEGFNDWREGDVITAYEVTTARRKLEDSSATSVLELMAQ